MIKNLGSTEVSKIVSKWHMQADNVDVCVLYLCVWGAGKAAIVSRVTGSVLQTEACLVTLSHRRLSLGVQQLVQAEIVHAVIVTEQQHRNGKFIIY